jgi:DNA-binding transcriptional LysR family regulator
VLDVTVAGALSSLSRRDADIALRAGGEPPEALVGRKLTRIAVAQALKPLFEGKAAKGRTPRRQIGVRTG